MEYGNKLNPEHSLRTPRGIKGTRQKVIVTHNPSEIDQNQLLLIRFPNLGSDDVIVPRMVNLSFNIELTSTADPNRTLVSNIGRAIIKKLAVKFERNKIMSVDDFDKLACYQDSWKTASEKLNAIRQGIISDDGCTPNCMKLRINAGRHRGHSLWLLTQSYTAIPNNIRRQAKMLYIWYPENRTDLTVIQEENDVIEKGELARVKAQLKRGKHTCLIMRMEHPREYRVAERPQGPKDLSSFITELL